MATRDNKKSEIVGLLAVAFDHTDEHKRITKSPEFILVGGSEETHANMQDMAIRFSETMRKRGKQLPETPVEEIIEILHKATDR